MMENNLKDECPVGPVHLHMHTENPHGHVENTQTGPVRVGA